MFRRNQANKSKWRWTSKATLKINSQLAKKANRPKIVIITNNNNNKYNRICISRSEMSFLLLCFPPSLVGAFLRNDLFCLCCVVFQPTPSQVVCSLNYVSHVVLCLTLFVSRCVSTNPFTVVIVKLHPTLRQTPSFFFYYLHLHPSRACLSWPFSISYLSLDVSWSRHV